MEMTVRQEERCLEIALIGELDHHAAREIGGAPLEAAAVARAARAVGLLLSDATRGAGR